MTRSAARSRSAASAAANGRTSTVGGHPEGGGQPQELLAVGPGVGGDAAQLALPEQLAGVVQAGHVGEVDPGDRRASRRGPAPAARPARACPTGANRIAASSWSGGSSSAPAAEAAPSSSASRCASGDRVSTCTVRALGEGDLGDQVRRGAEAVDAQPAARRQRGALEGPVADDAGAQQRSGVHVVHAVGQPVGEGLRPRRPAPRTRRRRPTR